MTMFQRIVWKWMSGLPTTVASISSSLPVATHVRTRRSILSVAIIWPQIKEPPIGEGTNPVGGTPNLAPPIRDISIDHQRYGSYLGRSSGSTCPRSPRFSTRDSSQLNNTKCSKSWEVLCIQCWNVEYQQSVAYIFFCKFHAANADTIIQRTFA